MLDTKTVSHLIKQHPAVVRHVVAAPMASLCVSAITAGELLYGIAKRPEATRLHLAVGAFLRRVDALVWNNIAATHYGTAQADLQNQGRTLAPLDLLIAAHALSVDAVLITSDHAFSQVANLQIEDWAN